MKEQSLDAASWVLPLDPPREEEDDVSGDCREQEGDAAVEGEE